MSETIPVREVIIKIITIFVMIISLLGLLFSALIFLTEGFDKEVFIFHQYFALAFFITLPIHLFLRRKKFLSNNTWKI